MQGRFHLYEGYAIQKVPYKQTHMLYWRYHDIKLSDLKIPLNLSQANWQTQLFLTASIACVIYRLKAEHFILWPSKDKNT